MRLFMLIAGLLNVYPAFAQISFPPAKAPGSIVTVLSDALSEPGSEASQILNDISVTLDKERLVRLLPMSGYGGPANVRDLLQLRGTDLAIVNNDVLTYLDLAKALPEARRKVSLVSPLFQQSVFLFGRGSFVSINDLQGRKIGVPAWRPSRGVTARTVLGSLKVKAEVLELSEQELARKIGDLDALLFYEADLPRLQALGVTPASYHLVPVPLTRSLAETYTSKKLGNAAIAGFHASGDFETIQVTALLAVYDWKDKEWRYAEVAAFVNKFFSLVPHFRAAHPDSPFSRTDVRMNLPGWKHFGPAGAMAAAAPPVSIKEDNRAALASTAKSTASANAVKLIAVARPPFTSAQDEDGGVVLKILTSALGEAGVPVSLEWVGSERAMLDSLIASKADDVGLFWQSPHCDRPTDQSANEAILCDSVELSDPIMQAVIAVFTRFDARLASAGPDAGQERTLCVPESHTIPLEVLAEIPWTAGANVKTLRPKTLVDCLVAVDQHEADALIAIEPEARFAIEKLKLSQSLQISQQTGITTGLHAAVAKDNPRHAQLIQTINAALAKFRSSGGYSDVMTSHLADLAGASVKGP